MANALSVLIPSVIATMQRTLRQTGGIFNLFTRDARFDAAALNQTIDMPEVDAVSTYTVTPGPTPPALVDSTPTSRPLVIERFKGARFHLTGEDWRAMEEQGPGFRVAKMEECFAALVHEAATYMFGVAEQGAGRALGAAGTSPFATVTDPLADAWKILTDYKIGQLGRIGALNTTEWATVSKLLQFQKANEAPAGVVFNTLSLGTLANFALSFDQAVGSHTAGTAGATYRTNGTFAVGVRVVEVDTGSGTILPGDVIDFAGTEKYVVESFAGGTTITLTAPLVTAVGDGAVVTVAATHRVNILGHADAYAAAIRPPAEAPDGDLAEAVQIVRDPVTGLALRLAHYKGYHAGQWEMSWAYGAAKRRPIAAVKLIG